MVSLVDAGKSAPWHCCGGYARVRPHLPNAPASPPRPKTGGAVIVLQLICMIPRRTGAGDTLPFVSGRGHLVWRYVKTSQPGQQQRLTRL
jgi:hypothetical protein